MCTTTRAQELKRVHGLGARRRAVPLVGAVTVGPYLRERPWRTVREGYNADGDVRAEPDAYLA